MMNCVDQGRAQNLQYEQRKAENTQVTQTDFIYPTGSRSYPATPENLALGTKITL